MTLEWRLHPVAGYRPPEGLSHYDLWDQVVSALSAGVDPDALQLGSEHRTLRSVWDGLECFAAYGEEIEPAPLAQAAADALGRSPDASGLVDHERIGTAWEQAKGTVSIIEMLLAELRTHAEPHDNMSTVDREGLAREIYDRTHLTGEFVLRSGAVSNEYFDKYLFEADPVLLRTIGEATRAARTRRHRGARGPGARRYPDRHHALATHGHPGVVRAQGSEDLRHVSARRGRRGRRTPAHDRGGRRDVRRAGDPVVRGPPRARCDRRARGDRHRPRGPEHQHPLADAGIELHALFTMDELKRRRG